MNLILIRILIENKKDKNGDLDLTNFEDFSLSLFLFKTDYGDDPKHCASYKTIQRERF